MCGGIAAHGVFLGVHGAIDLELLHGRCSGSHDLESVDLF